MGSFCLGNCTFDKLSLTFHNSFAFDRVQGVGLVSQGGLGLVSQGGLRLVSQGGSRLVSQGGLGLVS